MADSAAPDMLNVTVVVCTGPRQTREWVVQLQAPATVQDALLACGSELACLTLPDRHGAIDASGPPLGIWGRQAAMDSAVADLDRVEVYRPLRVDPKVARRQRFARQGARTTGLFARKRPGGKPGY